MQAHERKRGLGKRKRRVRERGKGEEATEIKRLHHRKSGSKRNHFECPVLGKNIDKTPGNK